MTAVEELVQGQVDVCRFRGELDSCSASAAREFAAGMCGRGRVVLDLSEVTFIDSCGLGVVVGAIRRIRETGGEVVVSISRPSVSRLLHTVGLSSIVTMTSTVEEAVSLFSPAASD